MPLRQTHTSLRSKHYPITPHVVKLPWSWRRRVRLTGAGAPIHREDSTCGIEPHPTVEAPDVRQILGLVQIGERGQLVREDVLG